jgi:glucose-6-phosphate 1-dehydrogenase
MVIFGATGDLTKRKLIPALFRLYQQNLLPAGFAIVGAGRSALSEDEFRNSVREAISEFGEEGDLRPEDWDPFASALFYCSVDVKAPESFDSLKSLLERLDRERGTGGNRLHYLSTPPSSYLQFVQMLGKYRLNQNENGGWVRVIIEKPFGRDVESARQLNREIHKVFAEDQVYRIDHYLGKETVQNIIVLRFANHAFEPLWNRNYIDHVQITAAETVGVENRAGYYESAGALRDMIQNHMLQLVALVAMEPPVSMEANCVRDEKVKVLRAMRRMKKEDLAVNTVRGQYQRGILGGKEVPGYREEPGIAASSKTETFAAGRFFIDNWRWAGVPFYVRSGKRLPKRVTEIAIQFRRVPHLLFPEDGSGRLDQNWLIVRIQPDEGISLKFSAKLPGQMVQIRPVSMDFQYGTSFGKRSPEAYERLLLDAMIGDATLYARGDMVELSWKLVMPVLDDWENSVNDPEGYPAGSWGPPSADVLIEKDGRHWRRP